MMLWLFILIFSVSSSQGSSLSLKERDSLRIRLEDYYNGLELIIRNQRSDESLIRRQLREFEALGVYRKIPPTRDLEGLKRELLASARKSGLDQITVKFSLKPDVLPAVPKYLYIDKPPFRFRPDQIAEELSFEIRSNKAKPAQLVSWINGWGSSMERLVEPETHDGKLVHQESPRNWVIRAHAFRFWPVRFPELRLRDPVYLLPGAAQRQKELFSKEERLLWSFIERSRKLVPLATPLYDRRREYFLNGARMSFFLSKAAKVSFPEHR
jgi:hypothetical protein